MSDTTAGTLKTVSPGAKPPSSPGIKRAEALKNKATPGWKSFWKRFVRHKLALVGLIMLLTLTGIAIFAPLIATHDPVRISLTNRLATPSSEHLLGTDETGRDVFSRLVYGARVSLSIGIAATLVAILVGSIVGATAGFVGGWLDAALMRFVDAMLTIPTFFLALLVLSVFGSNFVNLIIVIGLTSWMTVARVVRSEVLRTKNEEFVHAATSIGQHPGQILLRHVFPQAMPLLIVAATLGVGEAIIVESSLSYLGLGVQPPAATWGNMLAGSQSEIWNRPDLALYPGLAILLSVLAYNFVGDALRDTLDPRMKNS